MNWRKLLNQIEFQNSFISPSHPSSSGSAIRWQTKLHLFARTNTNYHNHELEYYLLSGLSWFYQLLIWSQRRPDTWERHWTTKRHKEAAITRFNFPYCTSQSAERWVIERATSTRGSVARFRSTWPVILDTRLILYLGGAFKFCISHLTDLEMKPSKRAREREKERGEISWAKVSLWERQIRN